MKKSRLLGAVCAILVGLVSPSGLLAANGYTIIDLGTLGGSYSIGFDINVSGQVTGYSTTTGGTAHAFLYNGSTMQDLGTLGGDDSHGFGINANSQVTGYSATTGVTPQHAFLYNGSTMQDLGTLSGTNSHGRDINASGWVTGSSNITGDSASHAFVYDGSTMQDLGTLGGRNSEGWGINASGWVTGLSHIIGTSPYHAFLYNGSTMQDLGTLSGTNSHGRDINDSGWVTGSSDITGTNAFHAFLYDGSTMHDLGTLGGTYSDGYSINASGKVVGWSRDASDNTVAFLYDGTVMLDLCVLVDCITAGWARLETATAINDNGDITGLGWINNEQHAFLIIANLPPVAQDTSASTDQFVATNWTPDVSDPDGDPPTCTIVTQPPVNQGIASVSADCSSGIYDPQSFSGPSTSFTYRANDGTDDSNIGTVTVTVIPNPAPVAEDASTSAISGTPKTLDLSPYISDGKGDQDLLTLAISTAAVNGTAVSNGDGTITYTSNTGFSGADTFGYTVDDVFGQTSNEGTVSVDVSVGFPPIADPGGPYVGVEGTNVSFDGRSSSDVDGRVVSYAWDFGDGTGATGFKPKHTYVAGGIYLVTLTVTDDDGDVSKPATTTATIAFLNGDSDNDGLPDDVEDANGNGIVDPGETDPFNPDSDGDGLTDGYEVNINGTDPNSPNSLIPGDMNDDGVVDAGDSVLHMKKVLGN